MKRAQGSQMSSNLCTESVMLLAGFSWVMIHDTLNEVADNVEVD